MSKRERHFAIRKIIMAGGVGSQEELRRRLAREGCKVTQATLSRDLKDLGVSWISGPSGGHYSLPAAAEAPGLRPLLGAGIVDILSNESLILVRTLPGAAGTVAEFVDSQRMADLLGTVAGDNTVLVIPRSVRKIAALEKALKEKLIRG